MHSWLITSLLPRCALSKSFLFEFENGPIHQTLPSFIFLNSSTYFVSNSSKLFISVPYAPNSTSLIRSRTDFNSFAFALLPRLNNPGSCDFIMDMLSGKPGNTNGSKSPNFS
ncbi:hypothetical protein HanRHA438_Chr13g0596331 [Helianthus annuus]|nr:hypothetical protein HanRHA438_Chr13g0596331 [Helianthus annuus]